MRLDVVLNEMIGLVIEVNTMLDDKIDEIEDILRNILYVLEKIEAQIVKESE